MTLRWRKFQSVSELLASLLANALIQVFLVEPPMEVRVAPPRALTCFLPCCRLPGLEFARLCHANDSHPKAICTQQFTSQVGVSLESRSRKLCSWRSLPLPLSTSARAWKEFHFSMSINWCSQTKLF